MIRRCVITLAAVAVAALLSGCTLYSDVSVRPVAITLQQIDRGADIQQSIRKHDFIGALAHGSALAAKPDNSAVDLTAFGTALLVCGRYDEARRQLRASIARSRSQDSYAQAAWGLSQVEYMQNNYASSLEWARAAEERGLRVRDWHLRYLDALSNVDPYRFSAAVAVTLPMKIGKPDVPRITVSVNQQPVTAIVDSGAVLSIISRQLADSIPVRRLGTFRGEFFGLLGEPILVEFGLIETLRLGEMIVENVPVAIMPNEKMRYIAGGGKLVDMELLLGANLLKEFRTELDFADGHVTFTRLTAKDRVADPRQNLFIEGFRPHVRGAIKGKGWYLLILDTGSEVTFLNEAQAPVVSLTAGMHRATMQGLGGATKSGQKVDDVEINVDDWAGTFRTLPMYAGSEQDRAVGILGENFLQNFKVVIDFGRMRLDLQPR